MIDLKIGNKIIGDNGNCFIIAEAGSNHDGKRTNAYELIEVAANANADAIKFQIFKADSLYSRFIGDDVYNSVKRLELPHSWIPELIDRCRSHHIEFLATPFDVEGIDVLKTHNVSAFKWASGEIDNMPLLSYASKFSKPMIISTGMSNLTEIENAIKIVNEENNEQIILLHCISNYPTKTTDVNLRMMDNIKSTFGYPVGFSDHTLGYVITWAAVARGAKVIEKHITLDQQIGSPDHPFSLKPDEFNAMVRGIKDIELSLGSEKKKIIQSEIPVATIARRSLMAAQNIPKGAIITDSMLNIKRPGKGISIRYISYIVGRKTTCDIRKDELITLDMLG